MSVSHKREYLFKDQHGISYRTGERHHYTRQTHNNLCALCGIRTYHRCKECGVYLCLQKEMKYEDKVTHLSRFPSESSSDIIFCAMVWHDMSFDYFAHHSSKVNAAAHAVRMEPVLGPVAVAVAVAAVVVVVVVVADNTVGVRVRC